ncbi:MAG TPA: nicotinate-nucleotide adenylyltransferase [Bacteroidales bacterium]|nr:MAG: hypothetical protein A2W98_06135 [Bacteroidetes bacterium GWF2_33_38]OFY74957.1 MAG: hypothetical protein A2265_06290 [Bacteroidetes bacterium RIFOXYA12_FULL_33_9]OFY88731.1 MAG: hypothetical protein A2236_01305 [Bacteroidetes bacterium RIFOXYA2_FULL_33_7]HBF88777.1 nicotinate-nucleotide adenylyltransferase [Bacteroidales bacterium]
MEREILSQKNKALKINLDSTTYGTIAEIGGGQEVARAFFQAGGASGTVAKTISAYDKTFSDAIYNNYKSGRHVSENRLDKMLKKEYSELVRILIVERCSDTRFFAFANTVETINYNKSNQGHGWLGIKFQLKSCGEPNEVVIHVRLLENDSLLQQYTLGILGINLIYACFYHWYNPNDFLQSLMDNLSRDRVEINMARMSGPDLDYVDNRLLSVQLVKNGMTNVVIFDRNGKVKSAADMLYKQNVLVFRGSFRPITYVGFDMLKTSYALFKKELGNNKDKSVVLCEMTLNNLLDKGEFDERDFLDRVNILNGMGQNVMISDYKEFYKLISYFSEFKIKELRLLLGIPVLRKVFDEKYYANLKGGIVEAFGRLFIQNLKIYVYPALDVETDKIKTVEKMDIPENIRFLVKHLLENQKILNVPNVKKERLHITSKQVLAKIKAKDKTWEDLVPKYVSDFIKEKKLFCYES